MGNFNKVILLGNVTRDVEVRYLQSGTAVADIGLAINEYYKDAAGEKQEDTTFVDVTLWARNAEVAGEFVKKGDPLLIEGRLKLDTWETEDGQKRSKLKVTAERLQLIGNKKNADGGEDPKKAGRPKKEKETVGAAVGSTDEDVPF